MFAINYTELRNNLKECMDKVIDDYETLIITRKKNRNVVMISEEMYNNMLENMHLFSEPSNYDWLLESSDQLRQGMEQAHKLIEVIKDDESEAFHS